MTVINTVRWGIIPVGAAGALALALTLSGGNDEGAPQIPQEQASQSQQSASAQALVAADAVAVPATPAVNSSDGRTQSAQAVVAADAVAVPATPAVNSSNGRTQADADLGSQIRPRTPSPEMLKRAQALREADLAASRAQGPAEACLTQMKTIFCPIIGNMPFFRDVAGQVAMWGQFDCPTGTPPKS